MLIDDLSFFGKHEAGRCWIPWRQVKVELAWRTIGICQLSFKTRRLEWKNDKEECDILDAHLQCPVRDNSRHLNGITGTESSIKSSR